MKVTSKSSLSTVIAILCLGLGCATTQEKSGDLNGHRTFAVGDLPTQGPTSDPGAASRLSATIRATLVETLTAKGYQEVEASAADFIAKVQTEFSPDALVTSSEERIIKVQLIDRRDNATLWSGQKSRSSSRTLEPELVRKHIAEMLASVPNAGGLVAK